MDDAPNKELREVIERDLDRMATASRANPGMGNPAMMDAVERVELHCEHAEAEGRAAFAIATADARTLLSLARSNEWQDDAERFRALMRCPRIKMQGSAGVDPKTGAITDTRPGGVHFGAEFWTNGPARYTQDDPTWGRHCLRALADDILAVEALDRLRGSEDV